MKKLAFVLLFFQCYFLTGAAQNLRAPAYPLITHDPYFSIWSFGDNLNQTPTKHWTGQNQDLVGLIKVDGKVYQLIGTAPTQVEEILPTAEKGAYPVQYRYDNPGLGWEKPTFSDKNWSTGTAPFGDGAGSNTLRPRTPYNKEVWYRREFDLKKTSFENLQLNISYDDKTEVFLNGVKVFENPGYTLQYVKRPLPAEAIKSLKPGRNVLAVHTTNTAGGAYIDAGLVDEHPLLKTENALQKSVVATATQTAYTFTAGPTEVKVTFTSPLLMNNLEVLARPASYVTLAVQATDKKAHPVQVLFAVAGTLSSHLPNQEVRTKSQTANGLTIQSVGTQAQQLLGRAGDDVRIDWGYAYLAAPARQNVVPTVNSTTAFVNFGNPTAPVGKTITTAQPANTCFIGYNLDFGKVQNTKTEHLVLAYDDEYSVKYFGENLRPWWRRQNNTTAVQMLAAAEKDYAGLMQQCSQFDKAMYQEALAAGGKAYADLCQLAYRQAIAAHKVVAKPDGTLLFFSKENFSNGSIGTVDVTYPSAPLFIRYNPELMKGMLRFIFEYSESGRWQKPFAAHDVGTYPLANGQTYGEDMPVEETGNMLILMAAIAEKEKNAAFAQEHWATLTTWAEFLKKEGFDPANQLSTDDFAGHLARNANLSVKAILGLASYGKLAGMLNKPAVAKEYTSLARDMAQKWMQLAQDGDHYTLAFGSAGTWSQKYNLVWDKVLNLNIFPASVRQQEIKFYKTKQLPYGLPLDSRRTYTKSDWILWTATLAENEADFKALVEPVWRFVNETPDRIPLSDWHETTNAKSVGFRARSVVGGYFIKVLEKDLRK